MHTVEEAKSWAEENADRLVEGMKNCETITDVMKSMFQPLWNAGEWLCKALRDDGANDSECEAIGFAHGQRCFGRDPWVEAVKLANEHAATGTTKDRPGAALGLEICKELGIV